MATEINDNVHGEEVTMKELILKTQEWAKYLLSKWYILLIAGFLGGVGGCFYAKSKKPLYTATTTFVLEAGESSGSGFGQYASMAAMVGLDMGGSGGIFQGDNLLELYKSRKMIEAALLNASASDSSKTLLDKYLLFTGAKELWSSQSPYLLDLDFNDEVNYSGIKRRQRDSVISNVISSINKNVLKVGKLDLKLSIIKIDTESEDEVFSKEFNEALVKEVSDFYVQTKTRKSLDNIIILQHKVDSVRGVMYGAISSAAVVMDATPNLNPTKQAQRTVPSQRSQFSAETNKAILGQLVQNLELSKMTLLREAPLIQKVDEPVFPLKVISLGKLKAGAIGSFLFVFLTIMFIFIRKVFVNIKSH